jgi:hypothetical protein
MVARGGVKTANEQERDVLMRERDQRAAKAEDEAQLDIVQKERERHLQQEIDQRAAQLNADLKAKQDVLAKDKIHDMFEGRPLAAIVAAISAGLGAFAATRMGGPNHAQAILDNAAQMFRQKELHRIEQEEKGVEGGRTDVTHAETRADAAMAQLYRTFARDRETVLRKRGYTDEMIAGDKQIAANVTKGAEIDARNADQNATIARQEVNDRAQRAAQYASAGHSAAETQKTKAETAAIQAGGGKEAGRGITDARQRAMLVKGLRDQDAIVQKLEGSGVELDQKDLQRIQDNRTFLAAEANGHGDASALKTVLLRKWGALPRSEFDGLDPRKQELAGAKNLITQKAALLNAGSMTGEAIKHASGIVDLLAPGIGAQEIARRHEYIRSDLIGANQGLVPGQVAAATAGADAAAHAAPAKLPPLTPAQRVKTEQWIKQNPSDPRVARAKARLME